MTTALATMFAYHAWANRAVFDTLRSADCSRFPDEVRTALGIVGHHHVVSRIFAGHLTGVPHGFSADNFAEMPDPDELRSAVAATDQWYIDYIADLPAAALDERLAFTFTDGGRGYMSRQEMLLHVGLHAAIHRGEVSRILWQLPVTPPWDTLAVFLHQSEPDRRRQGVDISLSAAE